MRASRDSSKNIKKEPKVSLERELMKESQETSKDRSLEETQGVYSTSRNLGDPWESLNGA